MGQLQTKHSVKVPEPQKCKELDVAFHAHEQQKAPEGEHSQVLTQFMMEQAVENLIQDHKE